MNNTEGKRHYSADMPINYKQLGVFNKADDRDLLSEDMNHTHCEEVDLDKLDVAAQKIADLLSA